jgi:hypothetical protein
MRIMRRIEKQMASLASNDTFSQSIHPDVVAYCVRLAAGGVSADIKDNDRRRSRPDELVARAVFADGSSAAMPRDFFDEFTQHPSCVSLSRHLSEAGGQKPQVIANLQCIRSLAGTEGSDQTLVTFCSSMEGSLLPPSNATWNIPIASVQEQLHKSGIEFEVSKQAGTTRLDKLWQPDGPTKPHGRSASRNIPHRPSA